VRISYGFSRELSGENLDADKVNARYQVGVLRLEIQVAEKAKPRKITVNADDEPARHQRLRLTALKSPYEISQAIVLRGRIGRSDYLGWVLERAPA
jgi:Hsp20/alpha crystallin family